MREERDLSQKQLGQQMFVNHSIIASWENTSRLPNATITGFIWAREAIDYVRVNQVVLAILDIELGAAGGFDLCRPHPGGHYAHAYFTPAVKYMGFQPRF